MSSHQTVLCRYHYDPLDRLAVHATAGETDTRSFYQKSRLTTQIQGALQHSVLQADDQLLAQQQSSGKAVETTLLATDQQRSVLQSMSGGQRDASAYTAYGHLPMSSGLSCLLGFDGERRDPVTGHYLLGNGYRAFNPVLMRFNSPDSLSPFGEGGVNAYAYCQGDPINHVDPDGHWAMRSRRVIQTLMAASAVTAVATGVAATVTSITAPDSKVGPILGIVSVVALVGTLAGIYALKVMPRMRSPAPAPAPAPASRRVSTASSAARSGNVSPAVSQRSQSRSVMPGMHDEPPPSYDDATTRPDLYRSVIGPPSYSEAIAMNFRGQAPEAVEMRTILNRVADVRRTQDTRV